MKAYLVCAEGDIGVGDLVHDNLKASISQKATRALIKPSVELLQAGETVSVIATVPESFHP
jgi:hypothetical protein